MITIQKIAKLSYILESNNITVKTMFNMGKIWLTKKEIANIYGVDKSEIKKELNKVLINSDIDLIENIKKIYNEKKGKKETFYSLDILLLLGYNSKHFKETKFLINTNNILKRYNQSRKHTIYGKDLIKTIYNYLNPIFNAK